VRVNTNEQNPGEQIETLKKYNIDTTFNESFSMKDTKRPVLKNMFEYIVKGDTLYIESISRLARNVSEFLNIVDQLISKEVDLVSLKESIDTRTPQGKIMLSAFTALSQFEGINLGLAERELNEKTRIKEDVPTYTLTYTSWDKNDIATTRTMHMMQEDTFGVNNMKVST